MSSEIASPEDFAPVPDHERLVVLAVEINGIQRAAVMAIAHRLDEARRIHQRKNYPGGFAGWVQDNLSITHRTAQVYLQVIDNTEAKYEAHFVRLSLESQREVSRGDSDFQAEIARRVEAGEIFTADQVRTIRVAEGEAATKRLQASIDQISQRADLVEQQTEEERKERLKLERKLAEYTKTIEDAKATLPTPDEAVVRSKEIGGGAVMASDGQYHRATTLSIDDKTAAAAFRAFNSTVSGWRQSPQKPGVVARGCPSSMRPIALVNIDEAIGYLNQVRTEIANAQGQEAEAGRVEREPDAVPAAAQGTLSGDAEAQSA